MTDVPTISLFDTADTSDDSVSFFDQLSSSQIFTPQATQSPPSQPQNSLFGTPSNAPVVQQPAPTVQPVVQNSSPFGSPSVAQYSASASPATSNNPTPLNSNPNSPQMSRNAQNQPIANVGGITNAMANLQVDTKRHNSLHHKKTSSVTEASASFEIPFAENSDDTDFFSTLGNQPQPQVHPHSQNSAFPTQATAQPFTHQQASPFGPSVTSIQPVQPVQPVQPIHSVPQPVQQAQPFNQRPIPIPQTHPFGQSFQTAPVNATKPPPFSSAPPSYHQTTPPPFQPSTPPMTTNRGSFSAPQYTSPFGTTPTSSSPQFTSPFGQPGTTPPLQVAQNQPPQGPPQYVPSQSHQPFGATKSGSFGAASAVPPAFQSAHHMVRTASLPSFTAVDAQQPTHNMANSASYPSLTALDSPKRDYDRKPFPIVAFGFGGKLITMFPRGRKNLNNFGNQVMHPQDRIPSKFTVHSLHKILAQVPYIQSLASFPGPLTPSTSTDKVTRYITDKLAAHEESNDIEALKLLWKLIKIYVDHYGNLSGSENAAAQKAIKEILLEKESTWNVPNQPTLVPNSRPFNEEQHAVTELQKIVLSGNLEEAYKYAIAAQLWTHALILSSNMNVDLFRSTASQFAETALREGSPLRTLYLLLSGKRQELFGTNQNNGSANGLLERWRDNLITLFVNRNPNDKSVIGALGDKLWAMARKVEAAHFCYMVTEYEFDYFDNQNTRVVLLGGDHKLCPRTFVNADSIQRTEIIEYARTVGNPQYSIPQIQAYKLIYAYMLAEVGLLELAKKYYGVVREVVTKTNRTYNYNQFFLSQLEQFEYRFNGHLSKEAGSSGSWIPLPKLGFGNILNKVSLGKLISRSDSKEDVRSAEHTAPMSMSNPMPNSMLNMSNPTPQPAYDLSTSTTEAKDERLHTPRNEPDSPRDTDITPSKKTAAAAASPGTGSFTGRLSGIFSVFKLGGKDQANLGEENAFEYNKELGVWLKKGEKPPASLVQALAPPPTMSELSRSSADSNITSPPRTGGPPMSGPPMGSSATSNGPPGSMPPGGPPSFVSPGGPRRPRYVDTFNTGAAPPLRQSAPPPTTTARQLNFEGTIFTPMAVPQQEPQPQQAPSENTDPAFVPNQDTTAQFPPQ